MKGFYIYDVPKGYMRVKGHRIVLPGWEHLDLFVHWNLDFPNLRYYCITEGRTGRRLGHSAGCLHMLKEYTLRALEKNAETLEIRVAAHIARYGISPRYADVEAER